MVDFESEFRQRLIDEFDCSQQTASKIAKKANQYRKETGSNNSPDDWVEIMNRVDHDRLEAHWNYAVGYVHLPDWGDDNKYKL